MDINLINQYIGKKVFLSLKNGFNYKLILKQEYIVGNSISFIGKFGEPITFEISEISFITVSDDEREGRE